ncbi:MAG: glycosyltransferase [Gammaproteobacteria bacterium]|nr:glycosyltransferase [Gammaproteobacteria bacterium]
MTGLSQPAESPDVSVVIPVYNEEAVLPALFPRIYQALDALERRYEVIFVDDGSRDRSVALLRKQYQARPEETQVVCLRANAGQHAAILAGFEHAAGRFVITLDADLQNPPEEIAKLLVKLDEGHDYVGTIRRERRDSLWRDWASKAMNRLRERITSIQMTDQGCMLRGYDREIIDAILNSEEANTFIPALAYLYSGNPVEVVVEHEERAAGESKYPLYKLIHLNFDLMTGFSLMPLQLFSLIGVGISIASFAFVIFLAIRRLVVGPEVEGVFTLFAIVFFLIGILLFGIGLLGEYVGRIYVQSRGRPRYLVRAVLKRTDSQGEGDSSE